MDITPNPQRYERGGDSGMRGIGDKKRVVIIPSSVSTRRAHEDERSLNLLGVLHRAATIINLNDISLKIPFQIPDGSRKTEEDRASFFYCASSTGLRSHCVPCVKSSSGSTPNQNQIPVK